MKFSSKIVDTLLALSHAMTSSFNQHKSLHEFSTFSSPSDQKKNAMANHLTMIKQLPHLVIFLCQSELHHIANQFDCEPDSAALHLIEVIREYCSTSSWREDELEAQYHSFNNLLLLQFKQLTLSTADQPALFESSLLPPTSDTIKTILDNIPLSYRPQIESLLSTAISHPSIRHSHV